MTNTYAPELTQQQILNSIYYWTNQGVWAPGIAFPSGSANPTKNANCHDRDFYYGTSSGHLWQYQEGDYPAGDWVDLGTAANAITWCGTTVPNSGSGNEGDLFNKYDTGQIYQKINGTWQNIGSNFLLGKSNKGLPLGADAINFTGNNKTWRSANLGLLLVSDDGYSSILATDQSFLAKKDIAAGGFISTNQGEIWMGHGRDSSTDIPKIIMMHSGDGYDTLYLKKADGSTPAYMNLGGAKLNAIAIGKDEYGDIPYEYESIQLNPAHNLRFCFGTNERMFLSNAGRLELPVPDSSGGLKIGGDCLIYRQSAAVLKLNANLVMDGPSFTIDHSVDNPTVNLKKAGAERVMLGHNGTDTFLSSRTGKLQLNTVSGNIELSAASGEVIVNQPISAQALKIGGTEVITSGRVLQNVALPTITYGMTNFANQNLLQSSDAIFNSVNGTSSSGALKAGASGVTDFSVSWNAGYVYLTTHFKHMRLATPSGRDLHIDVGGDYITVHGSKNFCPSGNNQGNVGGNGVAAAYWGSGWFNYLRYKNISSFDALDDLALVKQYTTKSIVEDDVEREVVDLETLPVVKADGADFVDSGKVNGFLLGCVKKLVLRVEKLEAELKNLEN